MAAAGINARIGRKVGHSLRPLESCKEGELCPHTVHMALRVEDGMGGNAPNAWAGCHQRMEWCKHEQQRAEKPLIARKGVPDAGKLLGVSSTGLTPGGEENSSDQTMIGYNHSLHKTN